MKNSIHRSDTFPYGNNHSEDIYQHFIETTEGWYNLIVDKDSDDFILTTPQGNQIDDCLFDIDKRKALYEFYEDGMIYEWLRMVYAKIHKNRTIEGETRTWFKIDNLKYNMRVNAKSGDTWITIPQQTRVFNVEEMYLINEDLPLIQKGILDDNIRSILQRKNVELPPVPYKAGLRISSEITNKSDEKSK